MRFAQDEETAWEPRIGSNWCQKFRDAYVHCWNSGL